MTIYLDCICILISESHNKLNKGVRGNIVASVKPTDVCWGVLAPEPPASYPQFQVLAGFQSLLCATCLSRVIHHSEQQARIIFL